MPRRWKWNDEDLVRAVREETSIKGVLRHLGLYPGAGNYPTVKRHIDRLNLDTNHWGRTRARRIRRLDNDEIFVENGSSNKCRLKERIIEDQLLTYACQRCGITEWQGEPLSLHLDHINGNRNDDRLDNLRFLCPNCHSLTKTYCGKSQWQERHCCTDCGQVISKQAKRCRSCAGLRRPTKIEWPSMEELLEMVRQTSYTAVGKKLGVSDNSVRKHIRKRKIEQGP